MRRLGAVCDVVAGQSPAGGSYNSVGEGLPFYQGKKEFGPRYIGDPLVWTSQPTKVAQAGDILMSVRAPVGPVNLATSTACIGRGLAAIRPRAGMDRDFLFYQLLHLGPRIAGTDGAVFPSISKAGIQALKIVDAPMDEQKRIVAILDEALEGIAKARENTQRNLLNAIAIVSSYRDLALTRIGEGWSEKELAELCDIKHGFAFKSEFFADSGDYVLLTPGNFYESGGYRDRGEKQKYYGTWVYESYGVKQAQEWLGHGDPATTLRHYVRLTTAARAKAVAGLDEVTRAALEAAQADHGSTHGNVVELASRRR
jgi:type I restriction enzyme S subunit